MVAVDEASDRSLVAVALTLLKANLVLVAVLAFVGRAVLKRYNSPLRSIPGPPLASVSRLWKVWSTWTGHTELDHIALHQKYGMLYKFSEIVDFKGLTEYQAQ